MRNFEDLTSFARSTGLVLERVDPRTQALAILTDLGSLVVRWEAAMPLVQVILVVMDEAPQARVPALVRAANQLNHDLPLPGFAVDEARGMVYFRLSVLRADDDSVADDLLLRMLDAALICGRKGVPKLLALADEAAAAPPPIAPELGAVEHWL